MLDATSDPASSIPARSSTASFVSVASDDMRRGSLLSTAIDEEEEEEPEIPEVEETAAEEEEVNAVKDATADEWSEVERMQ